LVAPTIDIEKIVFKNNKTTKIVVNQGEALKYNNEAFTNIHVQSVSGWKNLYLCI
jgi:branched-chain amino acid transport system substrate-binding protein